jgi:hypothetical protein
VLVDQRLGHDPALPMLWLSAIVVLRFVSRLAGQPTSLEPRGGYATSSDVTSPEIAEAGSSGSDRTREARP